MDTLPIEVREHIYSFLSNNSLFYSAIVCKSWNTVVTPLLYGTVILSKPQNKKLFYTTIYSPSRRHYINTLIKEVHFLDYNSMKDGFCPDNSEDLSKVLPNQEERPVINTQKDLRNRLVTNARSQNELEHMTIIAKNSENINGITVLARNDRSFRGFRGLLDYLQLFPQIQYLIVNYDETPLTTNDIFLRVLYQCPFLSHIYYGLGINTDRLLDTTDYSEYRSMRHLKLPVQYLTTHHIKYIENTFTCMQFLKLIISDTVYNREAISGLIHTFIDVYSLEWVFNNYCTLMETVAILDDFWKITRCANTVKKPRRVLRNMIYWTGIPSLGTPSLNFSTCGGDYTLNCIVEIFSPEPALFHIFKAHSETILNLVIYDYPEVIHMNAVNQVFPHLKRLELHDTLVDMDCDNTPIVNPKLIYLALSSVCMEETQLERLQFMYPKLTGLNIKSSTITQWDSDLNKGICTIDIPWNLLEHLKIGSITAPSLVKTMAIVRLNKRGITKSWVYDTVKKTLTEESKHVKLLPFVESLEKPLIVLRSKSITDVKMDCESIIKDETS